MIPNTSYTLGEIAARFNLHCHGNASTRISGIGRLHDAGPGQISFLANNQYIKHLKTTHAAAVILRTEYVKTCPVPALIAIDPYVAYAKVASLYQYTPIMTPGIHPSAVVAPDAQISPNASIGACCVIEARASVHDGAVVGPHCIIGEGCTVGAHAHLIARVSLVMHVTLGKRVIVHPGAVIGADGFGLAFDTNRWIKVPQLGSVQVGDDCEIGANTTIDRGSLGDTILEEDVRLDNQIQIAHNVHIGAHTAIAGCVGVAGSARIGRYCMIGGGAGILGHLDIADHVTITAKSLVTRSLRKAGAYSSGSALQDNRTWRKNASRFKHLDDYVRRLSALEKQKS